MLCKMLYTLFKLLEDYKVVIPVIQRDYAQKKSKGVSRKSFLTQIKKALKIQITRLLSILFMEI